MAVNLRRKKSINLPGIFTRPVFLKKDNKVFSTSYSISFPFLYLRDRCWVNNQGRLIDSFFELTTTSPMIYEGVFRTNPDAFEHWLFLILSLYLKPTVNQKAEPSHVWKICTRLTYHCYAKPKHDTSLSRRTKAWQCAYWPCHYSCQLSIVTCHHSCSCHVCCSPWQSQQLLFQPWQSCRKSRYG